jgi:hypothetical protein
MCLRVTGAQIGITHNQAQTRSIIFIIICARRESVARSLHTDSFPLSLWIAESVCVSAPITRAPTRLLDGVLVFPAPVN